MHPSDLPPVQQLIDRLVGLLDTLPNSRHLCIAAKNQHGVKSIHVDRPALAMILRGSKEVRSATHDAVLHSGQLLAMAPGATLDVVNRPDPGEGRYLTLAVPLCDEVLAAARLLWAAPVASTGMEFSVARADAHLAELRALSDAIASDDETAGRLAVLGLVVRLARDGCSDLLLPPVSSFSARVRQMVGEAPARAWQSADFEQALAVSGATLRRRLADEGTSLRDLVTEARLACALQLLYATRLPLKSVAARVGYRSADSFARRFRERYGFDAGSIGNSVENRSGTKESVSGAESVTARALAAAQVASTAR